MDKKRGILAVVALIVNTACCVLSFANNDGNVFRIIGSYVAFVAVAVLTLKLPLWVCAFAHIFVFFASSLGSVLCLYATIGFYDRIVHYLSGIVLGFAGFYVCELIFKAKHITDNGDFAKTLFAFLFSCACAAVWEIYEFTVDNVLGMQSQGDNFNTMGDIVAGVLGAVTYVLIVMLMNRKNKR